MTVFPANSVKIALLKRLLTVYKDLATLLDFPYWEVFTRNHRIKLVHPVGYGLACKSFNRMHSHESKFQCT